MTIQEFEFIQAKVQLLADLKKATEDLQRFIKQTRAEGPFQIMLRSGRGYNFTFSQLPTEVVEDIIENYLSQMQSSIAQLETELSAITICKKLTTDDTDNPGPDPE